MRIKNFKQTNSPLMMLARNYHSFIHSLMLVLTQELPDSPAGASTETTQSPGANAST